MAHFSLNWVFPLTASATGIPEEEELELELLLELEEELLLELLELLELEVTPELVLELLLLELEATPELDELDEDTTTPLLDDELDELELDDELLEELELEEELEDEELVPAPSNQDFIYLAVSRLHSPLQAPTLPLGIVPAISTALISPSS